MTSTDTGFTDEELERSALTPINQITEHLFLGNVQSRREVQKYQIKTVIRLTTLREEAETRIDLPSEVKEYIFYIEDSAKVKIRPVIEQTSQLISGAVNRGEKVLVHCEMGISRSSSVVIGYLIKSLGLSADQALKSVESKRLCVWPNPGFWNELTRL